MARKVIFNTNQTPEQFAYLAGIIDGEGCFFVGKSKTSHSYGCGFHFYGILKVTSCDEVLILWLENTFGGAKDSRYRWTSKKAFTRPVYTWNVHGEMLDYLLPKILPYLIIKEKHCLLMIDLRKTYANIGSKRLSEEIIAQRSEIMQRMRQLNSRFHNHHLKQLT